MNVLKQIQQGDVWIEKVDTFIGHTIQVPNGWGGIMPKVVDPATDAGIGLTLQGIPGRKAYTIALGEATGHHHQLVAEKEAIKVDMDKGIFELMEKAILTHEEHLPIELEPGLYRFGIINEYDYESQQNRRVWD